MGKNRNPFTGLVTIVWLAVLPAAPVLAQGSPVGSYGVKPGDILQISVWNEEDLQLEVLVRPDGGISIPLAGDISAVDTTTEELQKEITRRLQKFISDPAVSVSVKEVRGNVVYVIGKVEQPGAFVITHEVDVMQALSMAGGMSTFAAENDIRILRRQDGGQVAIPFRYGDVKSGENLEQNIILRSGDVVVVP